VVGCLGGFFVGLGFLMLLAALGIAVGSTLTGPAATDAQALGRGAAIWTSRARSSRSPRRHGCVTARPGGDARRRCDPGHAGLGDGVPGFVLVAGAGFGIGTRDFFGVTTMQTMAGDLSSLANVTRTRSSHG